MRLFRCHTLVHFLSLFDTSSDSFNIYLALVSATLLGVGMQGRFSWYSAYTRLLGRILSAHWFYFYFTRCIPTLWIFSFAGFSSLSNMDSVSSDTLLRVLLRVQYLQHFQRVFRNVMVNLSVISAQSGLPYPQIFLVVPTVVSGFLLLLLLFSGCYCGLFLLFPCVYGYPKYLEGLLRSGDQYPGKYFPYFISCLYATKKVSKVSLPCSPTDLLWCYLSSSFCWVGEN